MCKIFFFSICIFSTIFWAKSDIPSYFLPIQGFQVKIIPDAVQRNNPRVIVRLRTEIQRNSDIITSLQNRLRSIESHISYCYVGIKDGRIPNSAMTASSHHSTGFEAYWGRLDNQRNYPRSCWISRTKTTGDWLQIDFGQPTRITGVVTQGRHDADQWTTSYKIQYGNTNSSLCVVQNTTTNSDMVFQGNRDRNSKVTNFFPQPITARYFRLVVEDFHFHPVLRIEYLICENRGLEIYP